jgi:tRNA A-37 threonylcarbamoyl transferase component Bud32
MPADERRLAPDASNEGRVLADRYRLVERIDAGGAGEVWRARDERLDRDVAVKILGADADEAFRQRFADEARRAASVQHPNVVTVFDEGREGGDSFMVMEFVKGKTLRDMIAARGPLSPTETARLIAQVAAALDAAHEAGVIHCDVKPANVIVDDQGRAKLTDFGIARAARGPREHELIGTARYIAPERIEGEAPTERSDIYSLGLVAYELLAGRPANAEMQTEDLLRERLDGPPPSLRTARVGVSDDVDAVIRKALARAPEDRYPSAGTFSRELLGAVERGDATGVIVTRPRPRRLARTVRIDTTVALLAIIAVLVGTLVVFASFQSRAPAAPSTTPGRSGPAALVTPNLVGKPAQDAVDQLLAAGFGRVAYDVEAGASRNTPCAVARQDPAAGTSFTRGASAMIWYVPGPNCVKG